jgi:hypothetical protein
LGACRGQPPFIEPLAMAGGFKAGFKRGSSAGDPDSGSWGLHDPLGAHYWRE